MTARIAVSHLTKRFGGIVALDDVSFEAMGGEITGIIGPNGAGKTTLFNTIAGEHQPTAGTIHFDGRALAGMSAGAVARMGLVRTFQMTTVFPGCTVIENLRRAALFRRFASPLAFFRVVRTARMRREAAEIADRVLGTIGLEKLADAAADSLAYGQQKVLGVGLALTAMPSMMLMDEPAAGLNPIETEEMGDLIARIHGDGIDVILVEHDVKMVMRLCKRIVVLANGRLLACGSAQDVRENPDVIEAYLGADIENA